MTEIVSESNSSQVSELLKSSNQTNLIVNDISDINKSEGESSQTLESVNVSELKSPKPNQCDNADSEIYSEILCDSQEIQDIVDKQFPDKSVHNYFICGKKCCKSLSGVETQRLHDITDSKLSKNPKTKIDKFQHSWLERQKFWWLSYVESDGFYCVLCMKHSMKSEKKKLNTIFVNSPSIRMKLDSITTHGKSEVHKLAIMNNHLQVASSIHQRHSESKKLEPSALQKAFSAAYFLAKEFIANRKLLPLIDFMEMLGLSDVKHFQHRSPGSIKEIFLTIGEVIKQDLLNKVKDAQCFSLMTDEVTDVAICCQLVTFIEFYDKEKYELDTKFLAANDLLLAPEHEGANAQTLFEVLTTEIEDCELDLMALTGLSTDGASVMTGKKMVWQLLLDVL